MRNTSQPVVTSNICSVVALGGDDRSVSVWQTKSARPMIVAKEVFERQILDLSWQVIHSAVSCTFDARVGLRMVSRCMRSLQMAQWECSTSRLKRWRGSVRYPHKKNTSRSLVTSRHHSDQGFLTSSPQPRRRPRSQHAQVLSGNLQMV